MSHDVMLLSISFHEVSNIGAADIRVLEDGAHFTKLNFSCK